MLISSVRG